MRLVVYDSVWVSVCVCGVLQFVSMRLCIRRWVSVWCYMTQSESVIMSGRMWLSVCVSECTCKCSDWI